jgi:hypothetical protein
LRVLQTQRVQVTSGSRRGHHSPIFGANCELAAWAQRDMARQ